MSLPAYPLCFVEMLGRSEISTWNWLLSFAARSRSDVELAASEDRTKEQQGEPGRGSGAEASLANHWHGTGVG